MDEDAGLKVLLVEDDEAIREALSEALEAEGYVVRCASNAEEGLERLRSTRIHLVVTDYGLPQHSGAWMLEQARDAGLMNDTVALMITAHPNPVGADGVKVLRKPLDLDDFLHDVYVMLRPARDAEMQKTRRHLSEALGAKSARAAVEFTLYISSASPASLKALRNMQRLLLEYDVSRIHFTVCDLSRETPRSSEDDRVVFTPTLVKRMPSPPAWVLGDLDNIQVVRDLLQHAGVEKV